MEDIFKSLIVLFLCAVPGLIFMGLQSLFKSSDDEVDLVDGSQDTKKTNSLVRSEIAVQKPVEEKPQTWVPLSERSRIARAQRKAKKQKSENLTPWIPLSERSKMARAQKELAKRLSSKKSTSSQKQVPAWELSRRARGLPALSPSEQEELLHKNEKAKAKKEKARAKQEQARLKDEELKLRNLKRQMSNIDSMDGLEFESFLLEFFQDSGWHSELTSASAVKSDMQAGIEKVKGTMDGRVVKLGIVALNDCARFAVTLMRIMEAKGIVGGMTKSDNLTCSEAAMRAVPDLGDTFLLNYGGAFHGITVVAVSPMNEFVTLEAHASKLLKTPDFHCYSGMIDFVDKNFTVDRRADGRVQLIPHTAGAGIISTSGLSIQAMEDACGDLETLVKSNDDKRIFDRLQAPEDPRVTTYVPALYKS